MPNADDWPREMERYLAHFARSGKRPTILFSQHAQATPTWTPAVDVYETDAAVVVVLEVAGVNPEHTEVRVEPHRLVVRGVRRERHAQPGVDEHRTYHALEVPYGRFERILPLPAGVDSTESRASYRDGLLEITLPKRRAHQVRIATSERA